MCIYLFIYATFAGTLDGFLFDSDEEGEKVTEANPKEKNNGNGDQPTSKKTKRKNDKSPVFLLLYDLIVVHLIGNFLVNNVK